MKRFVEGYVANGKGGFTHTANIDEFKPLLLARNKIIYDSKVLGSSWKTIDGAIHMESTIYIHRTLLEALKAGNAYPQ